MSKWLAIANPRSGQFQSSGFEAEWMPRLREFAEEVICTDEAGAATRIAADANDVDGIVVVGGDGTIFEVIAGMDRERQKLGLIPTGRGNCLARDLGIRTVDDGFRALSGGLFERIDLMQALVGFSDGRQQSCLAASTIALGYVVDVVERADRMPAARSYGYALATIVTRPKRFSCLLDAKQHSCTGIVINNTVHLANFPALFDASIGDGLLDVMKLDAGWPRQLLHNLSVSSGRNVYDPSEQCQSASIRLSLQSPRTLMIDGQLFADVADLSVCCIPAALSCQHDGQT